MRVSRLAVSLLSLAILVLINSSLQAQATAQAQAPGWECYKCTYVFNHMMSFCDDTGVNEVGQVSCTDSGWDCVRSGMACAILPDALRLNDDTSPSVPGVDGGTIQLVSVGPFLWAGANCQDGIRVFVSSSPDRAIGLTELNPGSVDLALK